MGSGGRDRNGTVSEWVSERMDNLTRVLGKTKCDHPMVFIAVIPGKFTC
jgi:hypothetical protein